MWTRVELKENAKMILKKNYWWCVLVTLILTVISGGISRGGSSGSNSNSDLNSIFNNYSNSHIVDDWYDDDYDFDYDYDDDYDYMDSFENRFGFDNEDLSGASILRELAEQIGLSYDQLIAVSVAVIIILIIAMIIGMILGIFVFVPVRIGGYRWYIKNRSEKPSLNELGYVFSNGYLNTVKVMFLVGLKTFLWTCLFIVPGIIKGYEYRMIPYLLAENPHMDSREAFRRSRDMMDGNKANAFVLDLSFILWYFLAGIPVVGTFCAILWVNPYVQLTNVELYVKLCMLTGNQSYQAPTMDNNFNNDPWAGSYNQTNFDASKSDSSEGFGDGNNYDKDSYDKDSFGDRKQSGIDEEMFK